MGPSLSVLGSNFAETLHLQALIRRAIGVHGKYTQRHIHLHLGKTSERSQKSQESRKRALNAPIQWVDQRASRFRDPLRGVGGFQYGHHGRFTCTSLLVYCTVENESDRVPPYTV